MESGPKSASAAMLNSAGSKESDTSKVSGIYPIMYGGGGVSIL